MKRFLSVMLSLMFVLSLAACRSDKNNLSSSDIDLSSNENVSSILDIDTSADGIVYADKETSEDSVVVLELSINPQFRISLDKNYNTISIRGLNDEAKTVLSTFRFWGDESLEKIIDMLISKVKETGYHLRNHPINITVSYTDKKAVNAEEMNDRMRNITKEMSQKYNAIVKFHTPSDVGGNSSSSKKPVSSSAPTHTHSYSAATCTSPKKCSCGATEGKAKGHSFKNGKCSVCGVKDPNQKAFDAYINGVGYNLGQKLTVDIVLTTKDKNVSVCPCFTTYKKVDNKWTPYDIQGIEDFFGEEPTFESSHGSPVETEDGSVVYGHWRWMGDWRGTGVDYDFSNGNVLIRLKYTVTEKGEFEIRIRDGKNADQNNNLYTNSLSVKIY